MINFDSEKNEKISKSKKFPKNKIFDFSKENKSEAKKLEMFNKIFLET